VPIDSIHDLASALRGRRIALGLSQAEVAERAAVSREWINALEAGKATVELILVLRLVEALNLKLSLSEPGQDEAAEDGDDIDLDALLDDYRAQ